MKARFVHENMEFNFKDPPYKRYESKRGVRGPQVPNPKKSGYGNEGLSDQEIETLHKHQFTLQDLNTEFDNLEGEIEDLQGEIHNLNTPPADENELEQFYADIQVRYGERALDIINSGMPTEEKIKEIDRLSPAQDFGMEEYQDLVHTYDYYHPDEPDPKEIEELEKAIKKLQNLADEKKNAIAKLETKIYNIENY